MQYAHHVAPDAMIAAASHVSREYGYTGYSIAVIGHGWLGSGQFEVRASDGSQFELHSDQYGQVTRPELTLDGADNR